MGYIVYLAAFFVFFAVLARRDFVWALALFAAFLPSYILRFSLGPIPSTAVEGMALILTGCFAWQCGRSRQAWKQALQTLRASTFFWLGLALVAAALIASFVAPDLRAALGIWRAYFVEPFLIYAVAVNVLKTERDWRQVFIGLGCAVLGLTVIAIYQYATGSFLPTWEWTEWATRRATATFTSPNSLGLFVVPVALLALGNVLKHGKPWLNARFDLLVFVAAILSVGLAWSKGAMIALFLGMIVLTCNRVSKKIWLALAAVLVSFIVFIPAARQSITNIATLQTASGQSRRALYAGSIELIKQHPFTGTGLAGFAKAFETVRTPDFTEKLIYPHNLFLNFWLETGLLGLAAALWIIATAAKATWLNRNNLAVLAIGAALVTMVIHGLVDVPYFKNDLAMLSWILLAALSMQLRRTK